MGGWRIEEAEKGVSGAGEVTPTGNCFNSFLQLFKM